MPNANNKVLEGFVQADTPHFDLSECELVLKKDHPADWKVVKLLYKLKNKTGKELLKARKSWNTVHIAALIASLLPFAITTGIQFIGAPWGADVEQHGELMTYGTMLVMGIVAAAVVYAIDVGRTKLVTGTLPAVTRFGAMILLTVFSITISAFGAATVANTFKSAEGADIDAKIEEARNTMMDLSHMESVTHEQLDKEQAGYDYKYYETKGYKRAAWNRDTANVDKKREALNNYLAAKAVVDGRNEIRSTGESSNELGNTIARVLDKTSDQGVIIGGVVYAVLAELMLLLSLLEVRNISERLGFTKQIVTSARINLDELMISANATFTPYSFNPATRRTQFVLNTRIPTDVVIGARMPIKEVNSEQEATIANEQLINDVDINSLNEKQKAAYNRYLKVNDADVGASVECPTCSTAFTKKAYQHTFCKSKGAGNCKDAYHNLMQPERLKHAK